MGSLVRFAVSLKPSAFLPPPTGVSRQVESVAEEKQRPRFGTMRELVRLGPPSLVRVRVSPRIDLHHRRRPSLPRAKNSRGTPRPLIPAALCPRIDQRDGSPLTRASPRRRLQSRVVSAVTRSARSSGRSSPMSTASTPPELTTATPTCSWSASTCTTTRRPAAATCPVTF